MKKTLKITLGLAAILIVFTLTFPPTKISIGGGRGNQYNVRTCSGLYIQTYDQTPVDGGAGGWCFGKVVQHMMTQQEAIIIAQPILDKCWPEKVTLISSFIVSPNPTSAYGSTNPQWRVGGNFYKAAPESNEEKQNIGAIPEVYIDVYTGELIKHFSEIGPAGYNTKECTD